MACRAAIRRIPSARVRVTTAGSPSGIAATARVIAVSAAAPSGWPWDNAKAKIERDHDAGNDRQTLAQPVELALQRRHPLRRVPHHSRDTTHLRGHSGRRHHHLAAPAGNDGVHEGHVAPLGERRYRQQLSPCPCSRARILPVSAASSICRPVGADQPAVGRRLVARFKEDEIARNQFGGVNFPYSAIAANPRLERQHFFQRIQALFGTMLLIEAETRIKDDNHEDHRRVDQVADEKGDGGGDGQDQDEDALELIEQLAPQRAAAASGSDGWSHAGPDVGQPRRRRAPARGSRRDGRQPPPLSSRARHRPADRISF